MPAPLWRQRPRPFSSSDPPPARYHCPSLLRHGKYGDVADQSTPLPNTSAPVAAPPAVSPAALFCSLPRPRHLALLFVVPHRAPAEQIELPPAIPRQQKSRRSAP